MNSLNSRICVNVEKMIDSLVMDANLLNIQCAIIVDSRLTIFGE